MEKTPDEIRKCNMEYESKIEDLEEKLAKCQEDMVVYCFEEQDVEEFNKALALRKELMNRKIELKEYLVALRSVANYRRIRL